MPQLIRLFWGQLTPVRRRQGTILVFLMVLVGLSELLLAATISLLGVALASPSSLERFTVLRRGAALAQQVCGVDSSALAMLLFTFLGAFAATLGKNLVTSLQTFFLNRYAHGLSWELTSRLFRTYLFSPWLWHARHNSSDLRTTIEWRSYLGFFVVGCMNMASQACIICVLVAATLFVSLLEAALFYGTIGLSAFLVYRIVQSRAKKNGDDLTSLHMASSKMLVSGLNGIAEVQIYRQQDVLWRRFDGFYPQYTKIMAWRAVFPSIPQWCLESAGLFVLLGLVLLMALRGESIAATTGTLTLLAGACWRLLPACNKFLASSLEYKTHHAAAGNLLEAISLRVAEESAQPRLFRHSLAVEGLSFTYPESDTPVLRNIDLTIRQGRLTGFVGLSGMGKSTLINILAGLVAPSQGIVRVDGIAVEPSPGYLRIGYVPQQPYMLDASLAQNIAFSEAGGAPDMDRVRECCRMAALDFVDELPQGLDTILGERGVRLSGGQLQRVAIARALYAQPEILFFDEATSALDGAAESAIQQTILSLKKNLTVILVAHRLSTVRDCDNIFWIHDGRVRSAGAPDKILPVYQAYLDACGTAERTPARLGQANMYTDAEA